MKHSQRKFRRILKHPLIHRLWSMCPWICAVLTKRQRADIQEEERKGFKRKWSGMIGSKTRSFTWSPVRWHLWADGVVPHDHVLIVDSGVRLLVYHLTTQRSASLHKHSPFRLTLGSVVWAALTINEWIDLHLIIIVSQWQTKWKLFSDGFLPFAFEEWGT